MSTISKALRGVLGLFFDDGSLALALLILLIATGCALQAEWTAESAATRVLVVGTIFVLFENVLRCSRRKSGH